MTAPREAPHGAPPPMTPERWRIVDQVLDVALGCDPARRGAVVTDACAGDVTLRREVESLLAAHDRSSRDGFLERPAAESLGAAAVATTAAPRGRQVSARAAMYVAAVMLAVGFGGGWLLARSAAPQSADRAPESVRTFARPCVPVSSPDVIGSSPDVAPNGRAATGASCTTGTSTR